MVEADLSGNSQHGPVIWWIRRDLRLGDNPALLRAIAAAETRGTGVVPVYIYDPLEEALGAAPKFRLGLGLEVFARSLAARGLRLILRRGEARAQLHALVAELGASAVVWQRRYEPEVIARDTEIKSSLASVGCEVISTGGALLFEPWEIKTGQGGMYRVFTPFWKALQKRDVPAACPAPERLPQPAHWPESLALSDLRLGAAMYRGADVVRPYCHVGEAAALARLEAFSASRLAQYAEQRNLLGEAGTSHLSEPLAWGEISARQIWHSVIALGRDKDPFAAFAATGAEPFLRQLAWRDFSYHLLYHTPHIASEAWNADWQGFNWRDSADPQVRRDLQAWQRGQTGVALVDAAMRELYVSGRMHNRARMVVASYLCKHLLIHWREGLKWFADCLVDWDPAANAMGWQWVAGSGPDAAPYFRVFNPDIQAKTYDPKGLYRQKWLGEDRLLGSAAADAFLAAAPRAWAITALSPRPAPLAPLAEGRARALAAYESFRQQKRATT